MEDIFKVISRNTETVNAFSRWLFMYLGKDRARYDAFIKYPNDMKIPALIAYLESLGVNVLTAYCYYYYQLEDNVSVNYLRYYTIVKEFERIENKQPIITTPF